jgi:hypothetical protein
MELINWCSCMVLASRRKCGVEVQYFSDQSVYRGIVIKPFGCIYYTMYVVESEMRTGILGGEIGIMNWGSNSIVIATI